MFLFRLQFSSCNLKWVADLQQTVRFTITGANGGTNRFWDFFKNIFWVFKHGVKTIETEDETRNKLPINHQDNFDLNTVPLNSGTTYVRHHFLTYFKISRKLCCSCLLDLRALISIIKYF